jgi:cell division septum initiation protein DivIVA
MSIREQEVPEFAHSFKGYERVEVDEYIAWLRNEAVTAEERAAHAELALEQCRRELASSPTTAGISQRLAAMLQLANEEAADIRARARAESEAATREANSQAARTIDDATRQRDGIQRDIDDLSGVREDLVRRLIELGGEILGATERYRGFVDGVAPVPGARVALFDAEADADSDSDDPPTDPRSESDSLSAR